MDSSRFAQQLAPNMRISVESGEETDEVRLFIDLVWPPLARAPQSRISRIVWDTNYSQRVLTRADSGRVVSQVALIFRDGHWNSTPLRIGGIAGVGTDPKFRGQGLATVGMKHAIEILVEEGFDIGALFCAPEMVPFYERLGCRRYDGAVFIKQPGNNHMPWSGCMTLPIKSDISGGELDAAGAPW
jgi:predicted acetyltransferase